MTHTVTTDLYCSLYGLTNKIIPLPHTNSIESTVFGIKKLAVNIKHRQTQTYQSAYDQ